MALGEMALGPKKQFYLLGHLGELIAFDETGANLWMYESKLGALSKSPVIAADGSILLYGNFSETIHSINQIGQVNWLQSFNGFRVRHLAIAPDGTIAASLYEPKKAISQTASKCKLSLLNPDGTTSWEVICGNSGIGDLTIDTNGVIYSPSRNGLNAYNPDGTLKWFLPVAELTKQASIGNDGTIYVLSRDALLYAIGEAD
jgi:outer membrane protein assembly factor BamB